MLLSIIIPVYNASDFLIGSFNKFEDIYNALNSTEFEVIYINDGSSDNSGEILEGIKEKHNNIKILHQENQGSSGARNAGIEIAKGEYIQFLDSDDHIAWQKVIPLLYQAKQNSIDALSYRIGFENEKGEFIGTMVKHPLQYNEIMTGSEALINGFHPSSICCWFFKTEFLNEHNLRIIPRITHMDVEFTTRLLTKAKKVLFRDIIAYFYVSRSGSITRPKTQEKLEQFLYDEVIVANLIRKNITDSTDYKLKQALEKNYNSVVWNLLWYLYKNNHTVSYTFKRKCIMDLKDMSLYPIKGPLKTRFQKITSFFLNQPFILKRLI